MVIDKDVGASELTLILDGAEIPISSSFVAAYVRKITGVDAAELMEDILNG